MTTKPGQTIRVEDGHAAMTFVEIARRLGYRDPENRGKKAVFMVYKHGMEKLRARPKQFSRLLELSRLRQKLIVERLVE